MKVTMRLTLDDLVRALRGKAHQLAEELETGERRVDAVAAGRVKEAGDDLTGT